MKRFRWSIIWISVGLTGLQAGANPPSPQDEDDYDVWDPDYSVATVVGQHLGDTSAVVGTFNEICRLPDEAPAPVVNPIMGKAVVNDADLLCRFVRRNNADFPLEVAQAFLDVGERYGIRGDVALCQAIIETGWFRFADGTAVTPDQHNYCGLGVTGRGMKGNSFDSVVEGVTAQIQHLYAYCCKNPLPAGEKLVDPRFKLVTRGVAPNWDDLSNRWAMNKNYGKQIMQLYEQLLSMTDRKK